MTRRSALPRLAPFITFEEVPEAIFLGAGGDPPPLKTAMARIAGIEKRHGVRLHIVDARSVCGPAHLASALMHARRAHERGIGRARDLKIELMLYLTGQRQIAKAVKVAGLRPSSHQVGIAVEGAAGPAGDAAVESLHALDVSRSDEALRPTAAKARALKVSGTAKTDEGWESLALEVTAMLDLE